MPDSSGWLALRRAGVLVVLDVAGPHLPRITYWGGDLGELTESDYRALPGTEYFPPGQGPRDVPAPVTLSPTRAQGWSGWPGLTGHRAGQASQPLFTLGDWSASEADGADVLRYEGVDAAAGLTLTGELELTAEGVLRHRQTLTNTGDGGYQVEDLVTLLPVPRQAAEVVDHAGRWAKEAQLARRAIEQGTWLREQRRGRTGPDSPLLLAAGTAGFSYRTGEVWGVHLGWSGDQRYLAQRLNNGYTLIGAGELLAAGEVILDSGESVTTPWAYAVWSDRGLDGASARLHSWLRRRPGHPASARPITLNTWEAAYFDHSYERFAHLADVAAEAGVERFVIDDGWFGSRRADTSGLGDWYVSPEVWPEGLRPIADYVHGKGMQFGLWFEPEMVNLDSDVARAHPDWVIGTAGRMPPEHRQQQVIDVAHPDAFAYLLERLDALVGEIGIDYIKWDHNRDLADPVHRGGPRAGRPAVREQTLAAYELMAELKRRHPGLEIESCSSGGSRIDFGVLEHTDRVWASDCIDPLERIGIVRGIGTVLPLELIGTHVASSPSHTTGRYHDLSFRLAVALFGHAGIEWDLAAATDDERKQVAEWVAYAKSVRPLLHTGELVRVDRLGDPTTALYGVVSADRREALFILARLAADPVFSASPVAFDGLDPALRYEVATVNFDGQARPSVTASGALLTRAGLAAPSLQPEHATVYHLRSVG